MKLRPVRSLRTNNFTDPEISTKIGELWAAVSQEVAPEAQLFGIYHDYVSDYQGDYTLSICMVDEEGSFDFQPDFLHYQIFPVPESDGHDTAGTWKKIWQAEKIGKLERAYTFDVEVYEETGIRIFVAKK